MSRAPSRPNGPRRSNRLQPRHADAYHSSTKASGAFVCDDCSVVQHAGRWYWGAAPLGEIRSGLCPACKRIHDRHPAGTLLLPATMAEHRDEVASIVTGLERRERKEHPLERIIAITARAGGLLVTTTGIHLARRVALQLDRRFRSTATLHYSKDDELRVEWPATPKRAKPARRKPR